MAPGPGRKGIREEEGTQAKTRDSQLIFLFSVSVSVSLSHTLRYTLSSTLALASLHTPSRCLGPRPGSGQRLRAGPAPGVCFALARGTEAKREPLGVGWSRQRAGTWQEGPNLNLEGRLGFSKLRHAECFTFKYFLVPFRWRVPLPSQVMKGHSIKRKRKDILSRAKRRGNSCKCPTLPA